MSEHLTPSTSIVTVGWHGFFTTRVLLLLMSSTLLFEGSDMLTCKVGAQEHF